MRALILLSFLAIAVGLEARQETYEPARFLSGNTPDQPPLASAGGQTVLELELAPSGIVTDAHVLDEAEPFTEAIQEAARLWQFSPTKVDGSAVRSQFLVIGVFRPSVLTGGEVPATKSVRPPSETIPYPTSTTTPSYPPNALFEGVAMVEVAIDEEGNVFEAEMLSPEQGYDESALDAAVEFRFRPARYEGRPVASYALILFGFRQPVTNPRPRR